MRLAVFIWEAAHASSVAATTVWTANAAHSTAGLWIGVSCLTSIAAVRNNTSRATEAKPAFTERRS